MRTLGAILLGAVAGFVLGVVLNEVFAMLGLLVVDDARQLRVLRFVPAVLALVGAVVGPMLAARQSR